MQESRNGKAKTLLVVDDDGDIRELMKIFLEAEGYNVIVAADGFEAIEHLKRTIRPSLILLDLMMPRMDGEQFLMEMRSIGFAKIPVVIMAGHSAAQRKADELRVASCLMKPVELDELLRTIQRLAPLRSS
jgi:CheY-like chemotaxis protein